MTSTIYKAIAPLRLGLAGGGTDLSPYADIHGGAVVNATINLYATATITPLEGDQIVFSSVNQGIKESFNYLSENIPKDENPGLVKAAYFHLQRKYGFPHQPIELSIENEVPIGSGLGSSSTCTVALVSVISLFFNIPLTLSETASIACNIEREDAGIAGGRQDSYAATYGGMNFMKFQKQNKVIVEPIDVSDEVLNEIERNTVLYFANSSRVSSDIIREQIRNATSGFKPSIQAMHELKRQASEMKKFLESGNLHGLGALLNSGWEAKKTMARGISNDKIQNILKTAKEAGASGGKVSGAGGGGFMFFFCSNDTRYEVIERLEQLGGYVKPFSFVNHGVNHYKQH